MAFLSLGTNYPVPLDLFSENRAKLWKALTEQTPNCSDDVVVLQGGPSPTRFDTDHEPVFRQESYFWWLTGVKEPDCILVMTSSTTILLVPDLPAEYATIMGPLRTLEQWKSMYQVDRVLFTHQLEGTLEHMMMSAVSDNKPKQRTILTMKGVNTDSGNTYDLLPTVLTEPISSEHLAGQCNNTILFPILAECRVLKSSHELALLEHVAQVSSFAHTYVMRNTKPGMFEYQCESLFRHYAYYNYGSRLVAYTSICGCGPNAAILHYGHAGEPNGRCLGETDTCLFDMGAEYQCYASDITCSFPANGRFSDKMRPIYQAVLDAQVAVYNMAKPGVSWRDCHKKAEATILRGLSALGIVICGNKSIDDLVELRLGAVFMPHGMGHFIGIDCHDVGGYLSGHPERSELPGLKKLRTARILKKNMVLTVEPGCYFIDHLLDRALLYPILKAHLNATLIDEYRGSGGVRLEDVVAITETGCDNFTLCPRTVTEVEHVMSGGKWPPLTDEAPELRRVHLTDPVAGRPSPPSK